MPSQLIRGIERTPYALLIYADAGLGKSSLANGFPNAVFLGPESNQELKAVKFPQCQTYNMLMAQLNELQTGVHQKEGFETVVVDTIDMTQKMIISEIEKREGKNIAVASGGFGKAFKEVGMKLVLIQQKLETLRSKCGYNIIVLGHTIKSKFSDPIRGIDYDTYELPLHKGGKSDFNSIFVDWVSAVMLLEEKSIPTEDNRYAISTGQKVLYTRCKPAYTAKNRFGFPEEILLDEISGHDHSSNAKKITDLIDKFYASGAVEVENTQDQIQMIMNEILQLMNKVDVVKHGAIKQAIANANNNINELNIVKERLYSTIGGN